MREILFKAKRIDNGEWVIGDLAQLQSRTIIHCWNRGCREAHEVKENTICQYTGMTDKNGNKIWENDIVQYDFGEYMIGIQKAIIQYSIKYHGYKINPINDWSYTNIEDCEVIGNIFDNPELLKGGAECDTK